MNLEPLNLLHSLESLVIYGTRVNHLDFKPLEHLESLKEICIQWNDNLEEIDCGDKPMIKWKNVHDLEIKHNHQLRSLDTTFIRGLISLRLFSFANNHRMTELDVKPFKNLNQLKYLSLLGCEQLKPIDYEPLQHLVNEGLWIVKPNMEYVQRSVTSNSQECFCSDCCCIM